MINGDMIALAFAQGRAFPVMFFTTQDSPPSRYVIMDGSKHFYALNCECGLEPRVEYSMRPYTEDGTEYVTLGCSKCKVGFTLFTGAPLFNKARGAMTSTLKSWWNAMRDRDGHPNDLGVAGGLVATWEDFDKHMKMPPTTVAPEQDSPATGSEEEV